jgi:hypothetical protein
MKSLAEFHKNRVQKDGHQTWCKLCVRQYQNDRRAENPQEYRDYQRAWHQRHPHYARRPRAPKPSHTYVVFDED